MRTKLLCTQMMLVLLLLTLTACGNKDESEDALALKFRTDYLTMQSCEGTVELHSDYGDRVYDYGLSFTWSNPGDLQMSITKPDELAGITASIVQGETVLEFDGARLETGPISPEGLSPIDAIPAALDYIRDGYIAECGTEMLGDRNCLRMQFREPEEQAGEGTEAILWLDKETGVLRQAEMMQEGLTVLRCQFTAFTKA